MAGFFLYRLLILAEIFDFLGRSSESRILTEPLRFQAMAPHILNADKLLGPNPGLAPTNGGTSTGGAPGITHKLMHHSVYRSEAGGEVILVGFATAFIVAVVCYIRVTRTRKVTYDS